VTQRGVWCRGWSVGGVDGAEGGIWVHVCCCVREESGSDEQGCGVR
jgi:hypothetical protein